jgi:hypothetical protein
MSAHLCKLTVLIVIILNMATLVYGQEIPSLKEMENAEKPELPGARVPNGDDASRIAQKAYFNRMGGLSAYEGSGYASLVELGFAIEGFAREGDKIWEVRITIMNTNGRRSLRAIIWVHSETEQVYFMCGPWKAKESK